MSTAVEINGTEFITTREAAKVASYSNDYICKLAREQKIVGMQLGRNWFVDPVSLKNFLEQTRIEKELRKERLREERTKERAVKEVEEVTEEMRKHVSGFHSAARASVQACLILAAAALAGGAFWISEQAVERFAVMVSLRQDDQYARTRAATPVSGQAAATASAETDFEGSAHAAFETIATTSTEVGFLLIGGTATSGDEAYLRSLFSDEVKIEFTDEHTGTVTPMFKRGAGTAVRVLRVPVTTGNQ